MTEKVSAYVKISGKVQGVFFRAETKKAADQLEVCGWVRNRKDGAVEAVFQGNQKDVEAAIKWCYAGSPYAHVSDVNVRWGEYKVELKGFDIRY